MSQTLRVTLEEAQLTPSDEADLQTLYLTAATTVIARSMIASTRLVLRREPYGTTIEPFLGSASFEALLTVAKKRDIALALLEILVACAFSFCEHVGVLLTAEGLPLPHARAELPLAALHEQRRLNSGWYRIVATFTWFHFEQVEAKLLRPLKLSSGELATHYFREFWVRTVERQVAYDAVTAAVTKDAAIVVAFGEVAPGKPLRSRTQKEPRIIAGGRAYFSDRGH